METGIKNGTWQQQRHAIRIERKTRQKTAKLFIMTNANCAKRYLFYGADPPLIYSYLQFQSAPLAEFCDSERL
jgi:hypothetical protein